MEFSLVAHRWPSRSWDGRRFSWPLRQSIRQMLEGISIRPSVGRLRVLERKEGLTRGFTVQDRTIISGKYEHLYFSHWSYCGKDLWEESLIRENDQYHNDMFSGWNNVENHRMLNRDWMTFYAPILSDWSTQFTGAHLLGFPTLWIGIYTQRLMKCGPTWLTNELHTLARLKYNFFVRHFFRTSSKRGGSFVGEPFPGLPSTG